MIAKKKEETLLRVAALTIILRDDLEEIAFDKILIGITHKKAMDICLNALNECTHAYFLKDWKESKGAKIEHQFCIDNGIKIIYE